MGQQNNDWFGSGGQSLGLNLGLQPQGRRAFREATMQGNLIPFLQQHPNMTRRMSRQMQGSPDIASLAQQFFGLNADPGAMVNRGATSGQYTRPVGGAPAAAGQKGQPPAAAASQNQARPAGGMTAPSGKNVPGSMPPPNQGVSMNQGGSPRRRSQNQGGGTGP